MKKQMPVTTGIMFSKGIRLYLLLCLAAGTIVQAEDWAMWRHDAARTAIATEGVPTTPELLWSRQLPAPIPAWREDSRLQFDKSYEPIVLGQQLFLGCAHDDSLLSIDTETGHLNWRFVADGPIRFAPAAGDGRVFFVSDDGHLYCLRAADGSLLWKVRGGPDGQKVIGNERIISRWPARGGPVLDEGVVYFAAGLLPSDGAFVYAVDAESGRILWTNDGSGSLFVRQDHNSHSFAGITPQGYLVISGDTLIVPCGRTTPAFFDKKSGTLTSFKGFDPRDDTHPIQGGAQHGWAGSWFITADGGTGLHTEGPLVRGVRIRPDTLPKVEGKITRIIVADGKVFCATDQGQIQAFGAREGKPTEHLISNRPMQPSSPQTEANVRGWLAAMDEPRGYCILLGLSDESLLGELIKESKMFVVAMEADPSKVARAREALLDAGLYGTRATVHRLTEATALDLPAYLADLIISNNRDIAPHTAKRLLQSLHPYGGRATFPYSKAREELLNHSIIGLEEEFSISRQGDRIVITREDAPAGAGSWTHEYADAGNTLNSHDSLVRAPLGLLWFGGESARLDYFNRASSAPSPLMTRGRMFIQGPGRFCAIDIYTGQVLWQIKLPSGRTPYKNAKEVDGWRRRLGYSAVATEDAVYLATGTDVLKIRARDGNIQARWQLPQGEQYIKEIRLVGETLVATTPRGVHALATRTGARLWSRELSRDVVLGAFVWNGMEYGNLGTAASSNLVFGIYGMTDANIQRLQRRGKTGPGQTVLVAFNILNGDIAWHHKLPEKTHTCLSYSAQHDVLIQAPGYGAKSDVLTNILVVAYRGQSGEVLWEKPIREPGPYILHDNRLITQGRGSYHLSSGRPVRRRDPMTGAAIRWSFHKDYGCNYAIAGEHLLTFRSGSAGFCDIRSSGTGNFGGFRSGCRNTLLPAGGVIASLKFANGCICSYPMLTSMAFQPVSDSELWTILPTADPVEPSSGASLIRRLGINFGAPGDRLATNGTPWYDFPSVGGPSRPLRVELTPNQPEVYRHHASRIHDPLTDGTEAAMAWVGASGILGVESLTIGLKRTKPQTYRVRLFFAETRFDEPGHRVMTIKLQGQPVLSDYDIFAEVGKDVVQVKTFSGISARGSVKLEFQTSEGTSTLAGIELVAE